MEECEHYVTLLDSGFLPQLLCLHESLEDNANNYHLWILCLTQEVYQELAGFDLSRVTLLNLADLETEELLDVKAKRSRKEYCWTLTPYTFSFVFQSKPDIRRLTYIDADLYFFDNPRPLFQELEENAKDVLITEHAYDPVYDQSKESGVFCVQFITFSNNQNGLEVLKWWQEKCLEWCYDRVEPDRFGDQKYLDKFPVLFESAVHIFKQKEKTLGPWNAAFFGEKMKGGLSPIFYHFHGLRIISNKMVATNSYYRLTKPIKKLYKAYISVFRQKVNLMKEEGIKPVIFEISEKKLTLWRLLKRMKKGLSIARI